MKSLESMQRLGRALMLPIAVLPVAGILLRLGQADIAGPVASVLPFAHLSFLAAAGGAIFDHLGLLFAIGAAVGFARENHGAAGLAGAVGFVVATSPGAAIADLNVPIGILCGVGAGLVYNRYSDIKLPEYLAFFGGRRFVPIAMGLAGAVLALLAQGLYQSLHQGLLALSQMVVGAGSVGLFAYGFLNRLLIVTGLHHILNNLAWFVLGDFHGATGDLKRFFAGDPSAGVFMAGFFPVMMFGLPGACLAMLHAAPREKRKALGGMLASMALTSFLTGVTEPIEFSFMFIAPALYLVHMILTGLAFAIMNGLGVKLGFSFSAGLFDYLINMKLSTRPLLLLPVGLVYFGVYYALFRVAIATFNLKTPGREDETEDDTAALADQSLSGGRAGGFITALGGADNLKVVDACTTRLRLTVEDSARLDEAGLKRLGAQAVIRPSRTAAQVVIGLEADLLAGEIRSHLKTGNPQGVDRARRYDIAALRALLGGKSNILEAHAASSRVCIRLKSPRETALDDLIGLGLLDAAQPSPHSLHLIAGEDAAFLARALMDGR